MVLLMIILVNTNISAEDEIDTETIRDYMDEMPLELREEIARIIKLNQLLQEENDVLYDKNDELTNRVKELEESIEELIDKYENKIDNYSRRNIKLKKQVEEYEVIVKEKDKIIYQEREKYNNVIDKYDGLETAHENKIDNLNRRNFRQNIKVGVACFILGSLLL